MARREETSPIGASSGSVAAHPKSRGITPRFPLLLFETMRDMDRPEEILEDEDLTVSMPRRFGLSDVVGRQIHRFQGEVRRNRKQSAADMEELIRLVVRRPDAESIFREAGRRLALQAWEDRRDAARRAIRWMPRPIALMTGMRAVRRLLRQVTGTARFQIQRRPLEVRISPSLTARADPTGRACAFYSGALEELLQRYTSRGYHVVHEACETTGAEVCEWTVRVGS